MHRLVGHITAIRLIAIAASALCAPSALRSESAFVAKSPVIIVRSGDEAPFVAAEKGLLERLRDLGHAPETRALDQVSSRRLPGDSIVVAIGTEAAKQLHESVPKGVELVFCMVSDPEGAGLLRGRAAYGVSTEVPIRDQFELMRDASPQGRRIGMLYRSSSSYSDRLRERALREAPSDFTIEAVDVSAHGSISDAIDRLLASRVDFVWTAPDPGVYDSATVRALLLASIRQKTPVYGFSFAFVRAGAYVGAGIDPVGHGAQTAELVERIATARVLGRVESIPRITDPTWDIGINLIVADQLGFKAPPALVRRATQVFRQE